MEPLLGFRWTTGSHWLDSDEQSLSHFLNMTCFHFKSLQVVQVAQPRERFWSEVVSTDPNQSRSAKTWTFDLFWFITSDSSNHYFFIFGNLPTKGSRRFCSWNMTIDLMPPLPLPRKAANGFALKKRFCARKRCFEAVQVWPSYAGHQHTTVGNNPGLSPCRKSFQGTPHANNLFLYVPLVTQLFA